MSEETNARGPQIPDDMNAFNEKLIAEFRANQGQLSGQLAGSRLMLLTTKGAKTGKSRTAVLGYRMHGDQYAAIASANGAPAHPAWYLNLRAEPLVTVEVGAEKFQAKARAASPAERKQLAGIFDYLERQQARTKREIPIVVLERTA
ncbi:MAG: nitroreductase family deazaflavin-dependent oxidoreductase [Candidatus Dormibacteraceae bacterium]